MASPDERRPPEEIESDPYLGITRSHWKAFRRARKPLLERAELEVSRLELRIDKLLKIQEDRTITLPLKRHEKEQSVVKWQDGSKCSVCDDPCGIGRKHNCRLCGAVTCNKPKCTILIALDQRPLLRVVPESPAPSIPHVRACAACWGLLRHKQERNADPPRPPIVLIYEAMKKLQRQAALRCGPYEAHLRALESTTGEKERLRLFAEGQRMRKEIMDIYHAYDAVARRIDAIPLADDDHTQRRLHQTMNAAANDYLQTHMLALPLLTKEDLKAPPSPAVSASSPATSAASPVMQASSESGDTRRWSNLFSWIANTHATPPELPARAAQGSSNKEVDAILDQMDVVKVQRAQVVRYIAEHKKEGRADVVESLRQSLLDLDMETARLKTKLAEAKKA